MSGLKLAWLDVNYAFRYYAVFSWFVILFLGWLLDQLAEKAVIKQEKDGLGVRFFE